jgi:hypothetical protein
VGAERGLAQPFAAMGRENRAGNLGEHLSPRPVVVTQIDHIPVLGKLHREKVAMPQTTPCLDTDAQGLVCSLPSRVSALVKIQLGQIFCS